MAHEGNCDMPSFGPCIFGISMEKFKSEVLHDLK
jgi:hypothetical protein